MLLGLFSVEIVVIPIIQIINKTDNLFEASVARLVVTGTDTSQNCPEYPALQLHPLLLHTALFVMKEKNKQTKIR